MISDLQAKAQGVLSTAPCSIELPAGTGKTHLLAACVALAAERGMRSLVLTHTNAGVDAIRKRLIAFGAPKDTFRIETITSWAFRLARSYQSLSQTRVPDTPDWSDSTIYIDAARLITQSDVGQTFHSLSFDYFYVDEYQDCTVDHHALVESISSAVPRTVVFGDPLQSIFGFGRPLADWNRQVQATWPPLPMEVHPHRWSAHNPALGSWLLQLRPLLVPGENFDVRHHNVPGLRWVPEPSHTHLAGVAYGFEDPSESVAIIDKWPKGAAKAASSLSGGYLMMEDINGRFMRRQLEDLPDSSDPLLAAWVAKFAKACCTGLARLDSAVISKLDQNMPVGHLKRDDIQSLLSALEELRLNPSVERLLFVAESFRQHDMVRVYRREAWVDTLKAIELSAENGEAPIDNLAQIRDRIRHTGRPSHKRLASTPLLVKGLEYDHVVIPDLAKYTDPRVLYVTLSRARKSITILGKQAGVKLEYDKPFGNPRAR